MTVVPMLAWPTLALFAGLGLCLVVPNDVPRITGTVALIVTLAALGVAVLR